MTQSSPPSPYLPSAQEYSLGSGKSKKPQPNPNQNGFTLVEILVVVGVLAILTALITPTIQKSLHSGKVKTEQQNLATIEAAKNVWTANNPGIPLTDLEQLKPYLPNNTLPESPFGGNYSSYTNILNLSERTQSQHIDDKNSPNAGLIHTEKPSVPTFP
jgi:prepilin-type N-terminal cleavage/methylation domain-containing protein